MYVKCVRLSTKLTIRVMKLYPLNSESIVIVFIQIKSFNINMTICFISLKSACLEDACIEIVLDEKRNFTDAKDYCNARGGHIMEMRNEMENFQLEHISQGRSKNIVLKYGNMTIDACMEMMAF